MYTGIIPALLTPFTADMQVDTKMLAKLAAYFIEQGSAGLYLCGSTGEGLLMTEKERDLVAEIVVTEVGGQIPVIVHVGAPATSMAERLAKHSAKIGADAIASIPPMYYSFSRLEVAAYYRRLNLSAGLPLYFYNIPGLLNVSLDTDLAHLLFDEGTIAGMKYTHHDMLTFRGIVEACEEKLNVLSGPDELLLNFLTMGAHGGIGTTYNCMPKLYVDLYNAWQDGNIGLAQQLQYQANRVISVLAKFSVIPAVKAVMEMKGLDCGNPRGPFLSLSDRQKRELRGYLDELDFFEDERLSA